MSNPKQPSTVDEILEQIHRLQSEIHEREERIAHLVDVAREHREPIARAIDDVESRRRLEQVQHLMADWDTLVARSRAVSEDDLELIAALVRFLGDLLVVQPDGIAERWIENLEAYLADQRAQVS